MKLHRIGGLVLLSALTVGAIAADTPSSTLGDFKTPSAKSAAETFTGTMTRLTRDFKEKGDAARKSCIAQLATAQQAATKAGNLDEAIRIRDAIAKLTADAAEAAPAHAAGGLVGERQKLTAALANTVWQSGETKLRFNDDGSGTFSGGNAQKPAWEWVAVNGKEVYVRYGSGWTNRLEFDSAMKTFTFLEFGTGTKVEAQGGKRVP